MGTADVVWLAENQHDDVVLYGDQRCVAGEPRVAYGVKVERDLAADPPIVSRC